MNKSKTTNSGLPECPAEYRDAFLAKYWSFEKEFTDSLSAVNHLEKDKIWEINPKRCFATTTGFKKTYQCNKFGQACPAAKCLFYPNTSSDVVLFQSNAGHEHAKPGAKLVNINQNVLMPLNTQVIYSAEDLLEPQNSLTDVTAQLEMKEVQSKMDITSVHGFQKYKGWDVEETFQDLSDVIEYLGEQNIWSLQSKSHNSCGSRHHYRCNLVPENGPQCEAKKFFFYSSKTNRIVLYKRSAAHTHSSILAEPVSNTTPDRQLPRKKSKVAKVKKRDHPVQDAVVLNGSSILRNRLESTDNEPQTIEYNVISQNNELYFYENNIKYMINFAGDTATIVEVTDDHEAPVPITEEIVSSPEQDTWTCDMSFENIKMAEKYLDTLKIWAKQKTTRSLNGIKQYYSCTVVNKEKVECAAKLYLLSRSTGSVYLYRNQNAHSHPYNTSVVSESLSQNMQEISAQNVIITTEIPTVDLCDDEPDSTKDPDQNINEETTETTPEWTITQKFGDLQLAKTYLANIRMDLTYSQKQGDKFLDFYTCGLDSLSACVILEYHNEMAEATLFRNNVTEHNDSLVDPDLDQSVIIENYLKNESCIPGSGDDERPFVANYTVDSVHQTFQCFITTKRLLRTALDSRIIHADHKCTLTWRNYSMIILGTTDMDQTFHSFGICITSKTESGYEFAFQSLNKGISECFNHEYKPEILVCNSLSTIQNAFMAVYQNPNAKIIICREFMIHEIVTTLESIVKDEAVRNDIISDVEKMQLLHASNVFVEAVRLFFKKWSSQTEFLEYFKSTWILRNYNWYSGYANLAPLTNVVLLAEYTRINAESHYKLFCTLESLKLFMFDIVESWTDEYVNQTKAFAQKTTVSLPLQEAARRWSMVQTQIEIQEIDADTTYYYVPSEYAFIGPNQMEKFKSKNHTTLEELFDVKFSFWEIKQNDHNLTCSCPFFTQHFVCKHSLGILSALKYYSKPTQVVGDCELQLTLESDEEILS